MIRPCLALLLLAVAAAAAEPALDPQPQAQPLIPDAAAQRQLTPEETLQRDLQARLRTVEDRIADLRRTHRELPALPALPAMADVQARRDAAFHAYRMARQDADARRTEHQSIIATGDQATDGPNPVASRNRLAIADTYRELILRLPSDADPTALGADLAAGQDVLLQVDATQLDETELPRLLYLRVWFPSERARRATGEERTRLIGEAQAAHSELLERFRESALAKTAQKLLAELPLQAAP